jgi:hypothetical protein
VDVADDLAWALFAYSGAAAAAGQAYSGAVLCTRDGAWPAAAAAPRIDAALRLAGIVRPVPAPPSAAFLPALPVVFRVCARPLDGAGRGARLLLAPPRTAVRRSVSSTYRVASRACA